MRGSPISTPVRRLVPTLLGGVGATMLLAVPVSAADPAPPASVGPPMSLLPASPPPRGASFATAPFAPTPARNPAAAPSPGKHAAAPAQRIPLDAKPLIPPTAPLIPPAAVTAKLSPPPDSRTALSLETDLEPIGPAAAMPSQPGLPGAAAPAAAKSPSS
jgi:hypothetical protein